MMTMSAPVKASFFASSVSCFSPLKSPLAATKPPMDCDGQFRALCELIVRSGAYSDGGNVREIGGNTRSVDNIEQGEFVDERRDLAQE